MAKYVIGVDIGGTKIAAGMVDAKGRLAFRVELPTLAKKGVNVSTAQVFKTIDEVIKGANIAKKDIKGIGVCAPGPLDPIKGIVHNPPNLPGWKEVPLAKLIKEKFRIRTVLENDANAAGLAESVWGAAKSYKNVFYITVSTGIGTGIVLDGKIFHGKNGMAGEGGHVVIDHKDVLGAGRCGCGNTGCIEAIASGPGTVRRLVKYLKKNPGKGAAIKRLAGGKLSGITMRTIADAAKKKDKLAMAVIKEQGELLGVWIGSMINILDPEIIVIGGGVSMIGEVLFKHIRKSAYSNTINIFAKKTAIVRAELKSDVGIVGAASIFS